LQGVIPYVPPVFVTQVSATLPKRTYIMTRTYLPGILAMAAIVVASNILVQFLFGNWLTWGAFTYPLAFLVNDVMNRVYGPQAARRVVWVGFAVGVACSLIGTQIMGEYGPLVTLRIALGSGIAFLTAQLVDVAIFDRLRDDKHGGAWWRAPLASTLVGSTLDTALFFSIAFSATLSVLEPANDVSWAGEILPLLGFGPEMPLWVSLALADWGVKLALALLALVPFRLAVRKLTQPVA
jgi:queuosine precursor transporter